MGLAFSIVPNTASAYNSVTVSGLTSISPAYDTITVQRNNPNGSVVTCRNANGAATGGADTFAFFDYEAPLNAPVTYTANAVRHNSDGSQTTGTATSSPVTITSTGYLVWLKSLAQPALSMQVALHSIDDVQRPGRQQVNYIIGSQYPVVLQDVLPSRSGSALTFRTDTLSARSNFMQLMGLGQPIFLQGDSSVNGDGFEDMYFMLGVVAEHRPATSSKDPTRMWVCAYQEVASPSGTLTMIPGNSWLTVSSFGSWNNVLSYRASWLNVLNIPYGSGTPV